MTRTICVIGATGGQGGGVAKIFLKEPGWKVRGVTRDLNSATAKALVESGIEMVTGSLDDQSSLERAFAGCQVVFGMTNYYDYFFSVGADEAMKREFSQGCNIARAAANTDTLEQLIWSTLPDTELITNGEAIVPHFQGKGKVDGYIRAELPELFQRTTFMIFGVFNINLITYHPCKLIYLPYVDKWVQTNPVPPETPYPSLGDHRINSGIFVRNVVRNPPAPGTYVRCHVEDMTMGSYLEAWGRASGLAPNPEQVLSLHIPKAQFDSLWGPMGQEQSTQWKFLDFVRDHAAELATLNDSMVMGLDLLTAEEKKDIVWTEDSLKSMDWSQYRDMKTKFLSKL